MKTTVAATLASLMLVAGCTGMSDTEQRTLTGTVGGAAAGATVGAIAGNAALGTGIGAAAGLAGGYLWDRHKKAEERAYEEGVAAGQQQAQQ